MPVLMRLLFIAFASFSGYLILSQIVENEGIAYTGFVSGLLIALVALRFEERLYRTPLRIIIGGAVGLIVGLVVANLLTYPLVMHFLDNPYLELSAYIFTNCVIGYLGLSIGLEKGDEFKELGLRLLSADLGGGSGASGDKLVMDTNVIIDGRITDICETGFVKGTIMVPRFVVGELQYIADAPDQLKKAKGKRGLDILHKLKNEKHINIVITEDDFPDIKEVDSKLVALAKKHKAAILTNDINLTKVADINGVDVLNINALASALKPATLPGESLHLTVQKQGREQGQGISYLDDGTMVVIDNASSLVGEMVFAEVTSILQTTSGRMIFSKLKGAATARPLRATT